MSKLPTFSSWREIASQVAADSNQTLGYASQSTGQNADVNQTVANGTRNGTRPGGYIDPEIAASASELKATHNSLRGIFGKLRSKVGMIRPAQVGKAFDQKLLAGIDAVGAAHAIINPLARGVH